VENRLAAVANPMACRHFLRFDQKTRKRALSLFINMLWGFLEPTLEDEGATRLILAAGLGDVHKRAAEALRGPQSLI
jgi:hypothetical protein